METGRAAGAGPAVLTRAMAGLRARAGMDVAFAARVEPDGRAMRITELQGALTRSLAGLTVTNGAGLGGKSLALARPVRVLSYLTARGITHVYDHAVQQERMETVAALPVRVGSAPRFVLYLASRSRLELGDRWLEGLTPLLQRLERDLEVDEEVRRRLRVLGGDPAAASARTASSAAPFPQAAPPGPTAGDLRSIARELGALAAETSDPSLRARLEALQQRVSPAVGAAALRRSGVPLAPREVDVLAQVALGRTNAQVAEALGLRPDTVKSYLKTAMRKLEAGNRVQAIAAARALGLVD